MTGVAPGPPPAIDDGALAGCATPGCAPPGTPPGCATTGCPITESPALPNVGGGTAPDDAPNPLANPDWKLCVAFTNGDPPPSPCGLVDADGADGTDGTDGVAGLPDTEPPDTALPDDTGLAAFARPLALPNDDDDIDGDDADGADGIAVIGI